MDSYRIGEIAQHAGVSVPAVRYYERLGLLVKALRTDSGSRRYPAEAIERIRFVKQAQANGFTLAEIREWDLVAVYPPGSLWADRIPTATVFNGPVVDVKQEIESALTGASR
jgi:hypothetical protein